MKTRFKFKEYDTSELQVVRKRKIDAPCMGLQCFVFKSTGFFRIKLFLHIQFLKKVWCTENLEVCLHWLNLEMELPPT